MICSFFSKGNLSSVSGIHEVLKIFYAISGLQLNSAKSEIFSTSVSREDLMVIQEEIGLKLGVLSVGYLGVPLVTKRLTERDCLPLVEKITARINHWAIRFLSYVG